MKEMKFFYLCQVNLHLGLMRLNVRACNWTHICRRTHIHLVVRGRALVHVRLCVVGGEESRSGLDYFFKR